MAGREKKSKGKGVRFLACLPSIILFLSSCGVQFTDFNFSSRPGKKTVSVPEQREIRAVKANPLTGGPGTTLDIEAKVQAGLLPLSLGEAVSFSAHVGRINAVIPLGDDGVISAGDDGRVLLSRLVQGKDGLEFVSETLLVGTKPILAIAISDDKSMLALSQTSLVTVFDLQQRKIVYELSRVRGRIVSLGWDPRGELLAVGLAGGDVYLWSLKQSFFGGQGRDSYDSLEHYLGGESPIIALNFLPSGGAFLSAELEGVLSVWRALRTEEELGLRDKFNKDDQEAVSSNRVAFANLGAFVTDATVSTDGNYYIASSAAGKLGSWKIRGLVSQIDTQVSKESLLSFSEVGFGDPILRNINFIISSSQDQKLQLMCQKRTGNGDNLAIEYVLLAETPPMRDTLSRVRATLSGTVIWAHEKDDTLVAFRGESLVGQLKKNPRLALCSGR